LFAGKPLRVNARIEQGDDGCVRDYVFVSDVAQANALALAGRIEETIMNVGTGNPATTLELARAIIRVAGKDVGTVPGAYRAGDLERSVLDCARLARYLPTRVDLAQGLQKTFEFMREREVR